MGLQNTDNWQALTIFNKKDMQYNIIADISYLNLQKQFKRFQILLFVWKIYLCLKIAFGSGVDCYWGWFTVESKWEFVKLISLMGNSNVCNHIKHWGQHWLLAFYLDLYSFGWGFLFLAFWVFCFFGGGLGVFVLLFCLFCFCGLFGFHLFFVC